MILNYIIEIIDFFILILISIFFFKLKRDGKKLIFFGISVLFVKEVIAFILLFNQLDEFVRISVLCGPLFVGYFIILLGLKRGEK